MKFFRILLIGALPLAAQDIAPKDSERDPVLTALLEKPDEEPEDTGSPVLVTGNPPEDSDVMHPLTSDELLVLDDVELGPVVPSEIEINEPEEPTEPSGVNIDIEGSTAAARYDSDEVKLLAPFPAKPLISPPAGWKIVQPDGLPAFSETAELPNGTQLDLAIRPHLLVPDADGSQVFTLSEPGFNASLGYAQTDTIGSVLADTINALDRNGDRLDEAARRLSELLDSLPAAPAPAPEEEPEQEQP